MEAVNAEGATFFPGASGEQIVLSGVAWGLMKTGARLLIGKKVLLEVTYLKGPCKKQDPNFPSPEAKARISPTKFPDSARVLAKVLKPGRISRGDRVLVFEHPDGPQKLLIQH
ncbi:ARI5 [Symbiodinium pilosum]|uniref:ARI5 protein n=1 Tax=Symbiodinium pilosum TaxID=2952 RepID=A0A812W3W9_SYMPI|nr:ARI5 [Symbiodinium pilosum]